MLHDLFFIFQVIMANKPMPKIVGNEEDFREGFQSFIDLHGSTYKHVGAFCIKPPEKPEFNLELGRSQIHYPIRTWTQQCRKQLFADAYQIDAKSKRQDSMELCHTRAQKLLPKCVTREEQRTKQGIFWGFIVNFYSCIV